MKKKKPSTTSLNRFYDAIVSLQTREACALFFKDLCTPSEMDALVGRLQVAELLFQGEKSYREIHLETGVSLVTIGRVARFLLQENNQGYRQVLDHLTQDTKKPNLDSLSPKD